jgi:hypothetical protein
MKKIITKFFMKNKKMRDSNVEQIIDQIRTVW